MTECTYLLYYILVLKYSTTDCLYMAKFEKEDVNGQRNRGNGEDGSIMF